MSGHGSKDAPKNEKDKIKKKTNLLSPESAEDKKSESSENRSRSPSPSTSKRKSLSDIFHFHRTSKSPSQTETRTPTDDAKEFKHVFFENDELGLLYDDTHAAIRKYEASADNRTDRVQTCLTSLNKLNQRILAQSHVKKAISPSFQWKGDETEKGEVLEALQEEEKNFIEKSRNKLKRYESRYKSNLLFDTQVDFYYTLKQIILSSQWEEPAIQNNKAIKKAYILDHEENLICVPEGIERMIRVMADIPEPKRKRACCCFFYKPTPVMRELAAREEALTYDILFEKIRKIREIAKDSHDPQQQTVIHDLYKELIKINPLQLANIESLPAYFKLISPFIQNSGSQGSQNSEDFPAVEGMHLIVSEPSPVESTRSKYGSVSP